MADLRTSQDGCFYKSENCCKWSCLPQFKKNMFTSIYVKSRVDLISSRKKMIITLFYDHEVCEILKNASNLEFSFSSSYMNCWDLVHQ